MLVFFEGYKSVIYKSNYDKFYYLFICLLLLENKDPTVLIYQ